MSLLLIFLFSALLISFVCSILEAVLLSAPMSFIQMKEAEGAKNAALLRDLKQDIDRPISAILALNTIAHTIGAAGVGAEVQNLWGDSALAVASIVMTLLILVFSEIIPKTIGATYWRSIVLPCASVIRALVWVTYPLVLFSELITRIIAPKGRHPLSVSREEVSAMAQVGAEEGVLEKKENRMIQNLLKLDDITAHDIMTPSSVVEMAEETMTLGEFQKVEAYQNHSRLPIYNEENDDFILGYVLRQTILEQLSEDKFQLRLCDIARPILKFQEDEPVAKVWETLLARKEHISAIIDEYGCFRGIVTLEDVIETMLGTEIVDEKDTVTDMQELARSKWKEQQAENMEESEAYPVS